MTDLVEFIEARLAEDEQVALAATPGPWYEPGPDSVGEWSIYGDGWMIASTHYYPREDMQNYWPKLRKPATVVEHGNENAAHIARHDPSRVLREVAAHRRLLALHRHLRFAQPLNANSTFEEDHRPAFDEAPRYVGCKRCGYDSRFEEVYPSWWCDHVRLLALPYADHPDYRSEWAPS